MPPVREKCPARQTPVRLRLLGALSAALLLQGCGGYFSGQWPNLAEGFEDAAERDAALAAVSELAEESPEETPGEQPPAEGEEKDTPVSAPAPTPVSAPVSAPPPVVSAPAAKPLSPQQLEALGNEYNQALSDIDAARQAYEAAKAEFMDGGDDRGRSRWLTAQLKLTGLSRAGDGLNTMLDKLSAAASSPGDGGQSRVTQMARGAADAAVALAAYLTRERIFLTDQDPGS